KLQQYFNEFIFKQETQQYAEENLELENFLFVDNSDTVRLIEQVVHTLHFITHKDIFQKPTGIFPLLDEQCLFPKATDETFIEKINSCHNKVECKWLVVLTKI